MVMEGGGRGAVQDRWLVHIMMLVAGGYSATNEATGKVLRTLKSRRRRLFIYLSVLIEMRMKMSGGERYRLKEGRLHWSAPS